jgi:hypothetical protein
MRLSIALLAAGILLAASAPSSAARAPVVVTHGNDVKDIGPIVGGKPEEIGSLRVGFKFDHFGFWFINFWTWGGTYCVYENDEYMPISNEEAARLLGKEGSLWNPFLYTFPIGLLLIAGIIGLWVLNQVLDHRQHKAAAEPTATPATRRVPARSR